MVVGGIDAPVYSHRVNWMNSHSTLSKMTAPINIYKTYRNVDIHVKILQIKITPSRLFKCRPNTALYKVRYKIQLLLLILLYTLGSIDSEGKKYSLKTRNYYYYYY